MKGVGLVEYFCLPLGVPSASMPGKALMEELFTYLAHVLCAVRDLGFSLMGQKQKH